MSKKILILSTFFPPQNSIASLRPYSWAKYWSQAGHEVDVLTTQKLRQSATDLNLPVENFNVLEVPYPNFLNKLKSDYQTSSAVQPSASLAPKQLLRRGFNFLRTKTGIFSSCRMPDFADFWMGQALRHVKDRHWDLVVSTAGPYTVHLMAERLKKNGQVNQWIADYRDTWSNNYIYNGLFPFNLIEKFLEKKILRLADAITTVSNPLTNSLSLKHGKEKVHTIENGFDSGDLAKLDPTPIFPNDGKFRIVHTGSIYLGKRDPTPLFEAIASLRHHEVLKKLSVLFVGPNQANLQELIRLHQIEEWVEVVGFISREDALRMQRDAHALLFLPWNDLSVNGIMTGKLFEYLHSGTQIIAVGASGIEASQALIMDSGCGKAFHNPEALKNFLLKELELVQKKPVVLSREIADRYERKALALKLLELL